MSDIDKLLYVLNMLNIEYYDYYRPSGEADVQICDHDSNIIAVMWFDADGKFESCAVCND